MCSYITCTYIYIDINAKCFDLNIFQQDECFCSKLRLDGEHAKSNISDLSDFSLALFLKNILKPKNHTCMLTQITHF